MKKKTINKVNGGIAIYYGISAGIGTIAALVGTATWLYKALTDQTSFSWGILAGLLVITAVLGFMGYSILRVGYEEMEKGIRNKS